jgi:hypothetical protein
MQGASVEVDVADFPGAFEPIWAPSLQLMAGPGGPHLNKGDRNDSLDRQPHQPERPTLRRVDPVYSTSAGSNRDYGGPARPGARHFIQREIMKKASRVAGRVRPVLGMPFG